GFQEFGMSGRSLGPQDRTGHGVRIEVQIELAVRNIPYRLSAHEDQQVIGRRGAGLPADMGASHLIENRSAPSAGRANGDGPATVGMAPYGSQIEDAFKDSDGGRLA